MYVHTFLIMFWFFETTILLAYNSDNLQNYLNFAPVTLNARFINKFFVYKCSNSNIFFVKSTSRQPGGIL